MQRRAVLNRPGLIVQSDTRRERRLALGASQAVSSNNAWMPTPTRAPTTVPLIRTN